MTFNSVIECLSIIGLGIGAVKISNRFRYGAFAYFGSFVGILIVGALLGDLG